MKPAPFDYLRPTSTNEALSALAEHVGDAKLLAGGQNLVPMLNMRLLQPRVVIDLNALSELDGVQEDNGEVRIGALTRYSTLETSAIVRRRLPLMADAIRYIGDRQIRNRGTIAGGLARADPSAEMPLIAVALEATLTVRSRNGGREVAAVDLFEGPYQTSLHDDELITDIRFHDAGNRMHTFLELARRHGDYPIVSIAAVGQPGRGETWESVRLVLGAVGDTPLVPKQGGELLAGSRLDDAVIAKAAHACATLAEPPTDVRASGEYRRHVLPIYVRRALEQLREQRKARG